jgi:carboxyl-terminal processing protease
MFEFIKSNRNRNFIVVILLVVGSFILGINVGVSRIPYIDRIVGISSKEAPITNTADFSPFWKAWDAINEKSPEAKNISNQDKVYGAISGLVGSLNDPYSVFFKPDEAKSFEEDISGNFTGIGTEVGIKDKILTIISPLKDSPAEKAGLKPGDKVLKIDSKSTSDLTIDEAIKLMRGEKGTLVTLTIFREGEKTTRDIKIMRDIINIPTLDTEMRSDGVFVIRLYTFTANSAQLFRDAIKKFTESNTDKLVLDLRGNPGGYLDAAVDMASWFLPSGKVIVTEDYGEGKDPTVHRSLGYNIFTDKLKFVILMNGGSASASEILAGAMHDQGKAKLVGTQSYGKGSVQEVVKVTPDTLLKITVAKWLTPNGTSISLKGLTPDYKVEVTQKDLDNKVDPQLNKAVDLLKNWQ